MADFPHSTVPLLDDAVTEEHIPPEFRIAQSVSHVEARDSWGGAFRRRWTVNLKLLGATALAELVTFYQSMYGPVGAFYFTPPRGGSPVLCRFESATLSLQRVTSTYWPATVSIIEVLS